MKACFLLLLTGAISVQAVTIVEQDFDTATSWTPTYSPDLDSFSATSDVWGLRTSLSSISVGSGQFLGAQDIENPDNPNNVFASVSFAPTNTSGFSDIGISFDYDVIGFDTGDDLIYEVIIDGVGQGQVILVDGGVGGISAGGTEIITIPDGSGEVGLVVTIDQNGASDFAGLDNFVLSGTIPEPSSAILGGLGLLALVRRRR